MEIAQWLGIFFIGLTVLLISAHYFTETAEKIGLHFKMSPFVIGVIIVSIGTSLPEIITSLIAVFENESVIVIGNVTGSNIANILLVLAITAIVGKHLVVNKEIMSIDLPILLGSSILLFITTLDGKFTYIDGTICLIALITYVVYNAKSHRGIAEKEMREISKKKKQEKEIDQKERLHLKYPIILIASGTFLYFSADYTIEAVIELSKMLNIATEIIAVSAVAIGTSLPELIVSIMAALKGKADLAIGNVTGSNIFNTLGVMGIPSLFGTLEISQEMISFTIPVMVFVTILYLFVTMDKQVSKWEGITLLLLYVAFIGKIFGVV